MRKKDHIAIAKIIKEQLDHAGDDSRVHIIGVACDLADYMAQDNLCVQDNLHFDYHKFMAACGIDEWQ